MVQSTQKKREPNDTQKPPHIAWRLTVGLVCPGLNTIKFSDDTTVVGLIRDDEMAYKDEVQHLTLWCADNNVVLNTQKTKGVHCGLQTN